MNMNKEVIKLAKLLRTSEEVILNLEKKMEKISGQKGVVEKIVQENDRQVERVLKELRFRSLAPKEGKKGAKLLNPKLLTPKHDYS